MLPLRDASCQFLLEALRPHNCCSLLMRSYAINCEPLTQRCLDTLTLDFVAVVECDPGFVELGAAVLRSIIARDNLVCAKEREVFEALLKWYAVRPAEKHAALLEMLPLVRWAFVFDERPGDLAPAPVEETMARRKKLLAGLRDALAGAYRTGEEAGASGSRKTISSKSKPKTEPAAESAAGPSASSSSANVPREFFLSCSAAEEEEAEEEETQCVSGMRKKQKMVAAAPQCKVKVDQEPVYRSLGCEAEVHAGSPRSCAATAAESAAAELEASVEQCLAQQLPAQQGEAACRPRHYTWGTLVGRNPEPPSSQPFTPDVQTWRLESRQEYVVGRSRKSTIRIGHDAPMPYISSHHFRVYNQIEWAAGPSPSTQDSSQSVTEQSASQDASQGAPGGAPRLEAWLEDLSQNGTFINGKLVGREGKQKLKDGDRIELVFPRDSAEHPTSNVNHFPTFTYHAPQGGAGCSTQETVMKYFQSNSNMAPLENGSETDIGCTISDCVNAVAPQGVTDAQVRAAVEALVNVGYLYSTIDDEHYTVTQSPSSSPSSGRS